MVTQLRDRLHQKFHDPPVDAVPIAVYLPDGIKIEYKFSPADVTKVRLVGEEGRHGITQERIKVVT